MNRLVVATHNESKAREINQLLGPVGIEVLSAGALNLPEPEETGVTFAKNALIKSQNAAALSGHYALADDSGLCVEGLGGAPGIYSARWAQPGKNFDAAFERIRTELLAKNIMPDGASAYFICVLALTAPSGESRTFEGRVDGVLTFPPRGKDGFGYDPIFIPKGQSETFAQMDAQAKHAISHRARAFKALEAYLAQRKAS